jgi:hypothetical protein
MAVMTGMLDDTEIDVAAIMQSVGQVLEEHLGFVPDAVIVLRAPDGQCRTFCASSLMSADRYGSEIAVRQSFAKMLAQAVEHQRAITESLTRQQQ